MKGQGIILAVLVCILLVCGCGKAGGNETKPAWTKASVPEEETDPAEIREPQANPRTDSRTNSQTGVPESGAEAVDIERKDCVFFTDFIQERENYGFLLSEYTTPADVDLGEVFYSGAGIAEAIPDEDIPLYLAAREQEEIWTDCLKLPKQDAEEFLQEKLGIGLADMNKPFEWLYLPETDAYYCESGDTNYCAFGCIEGIRQGNIYTLRFVPSAEWDSWFHDCETVIEKTEDGYRFLSNQFMEE